ncbi:hypothetical protein QQ045_029890 [Rhodiola kirilowii]
MKINNHTENGANKHRKHRNIIRVKRVHSSAAVISSPKRGFKIRHKPKWPNRRSSSETNFKSSIKRRPHFFKEIQQDRSLLLQLENSRATSHPRQEKHRPKH